MGLRASSWRHTTLGVAVLVVASVALTGCPRRPSVMPGAASTGGAGMSGSGTPAPGAGGLAKPAASAGASAAGRTAGSSAGAGTVIPALPSPSEYVETSALRDIHFDFDRYEIRPDARPILEESARWLKTQSKAQVLIEGHCDERGTNEYNLALGDRRARATRDYLVSLGIDQARITTISYGEERPLCTDRTEACWAQNRRAHFLVKQ